MGFCNRDPTPIILRGQDGQDMAGGAGLGPLCILRG